MQSKASFWQEKLIKLAEISKILNVRDQTEGM